MKRSVTSFDLDQHLTSFSLTRSSDSTLLYQTQPGYDAVGNVSSVSTTLQAGTDIQHFCYDEQNRLTSASANGAASCGSFTAGTLTSAQYQQNYTYDTNGRLTTSSQGSYTYGSSSHLHAVTSTGSGYSAAYDAAGNMICRAPSSATTCSGTQTGQQLSYDAEGNLSTWQNQPTPTSTVNYLYDGEGTRVASQLVSGGTTTLTSYLGNLETIVAGSSTTTTTYYSAGGLRIAEAVNGTFSYLGSDVLGSAAVALNASGQLTAAQLYGPYGNVRYSSGTMPTDIGFTGQRGDSATGLDYYGARYYDPAVGQFISADTVLPGGGFNPWGLSRYAYVRGDPETMTDPTGHRVACGSNCGSGGPPTPNDCNADPSLSGCGGGAPPPQHGRVPAGNGNRSGSPRGGGNRGGSPRGPGSITMAQRITGIELWCYFDTECYADQQDPTGEGRQFWAFVEFAAFFWLSGGEAGVSDDAAASSTSALWLQVEKALASKNEGTVAEGELAEIVGRNSPLVNFRKPLAGQGDIDVETPEAIYESKAGGNASSADILKKWNSVATNPDFNPTGKPFVVYAPKWDAKQIENVYDYVDLTISFSPGSQQLAVRFAHVCCQHWPCIVDDENGRLFSCQEIEYLYKGGGGFTTYGL